MSTKYIASNWRLPNKAGVDSYKNDNYGLTFDGSSELINCGTGEIVTGEFTVSMWIKRNLIGGDSTQIFFSKADVNGSRTFACYLNKSAGYLQFYVSNTGSIISSKRITTSETITDENWHHLVFINNGDSGLLKIYIDGSEATTQGRTGISNLYSSSIPNIIGNSNVGSNDFSGSISELSVFNYVLSEPQISTLYGSSSLGAGNPMALKPQPVAYYPLGDNSASNPLTQPNEAVEDASVFDFVPNDYIIADVDGTGGSDSSFELGSDLEFTVSFWFNRSSSSSQIGLFQWANVITSGSPFLLIQQNSNNLRAFYDGGYRTNIATSQNIWYHISITRTASDNTLRGYLNGSEWFSYDDGGTPALQNVATNIYFGNGYGNYFTGQLSNGQIWNTALSSTEVTTLYNSGVPLLTGTQPQASNLKAWYKLDQSANWEADSSGAWQIPDNRSAYPQSFDFNGSTSYITYNRNPSISTSNVTISGWFKTDKTSGTQGIVGGAGNDGMPIWLVVGKLAYYQWTSGGWGPNMIYNVVLNTNEWYHFAATWDESTTTRVLYLNGEAVLTNTTTTDLVWNNNYGYLGRYSSSEFDGQLSNIQIHNSTLPATGANSIQTLYNNGVPLETAIDTTNLYGWWKLDNTATWTGSAYSVPDESVNGNTGTSSNMTEQNLVNNNVSALNGESSGMTSANLVLSDLTRAVPYGDGYSFNFDAASNDSINTNQTLSNSYTALTLSGWVKYTTISDYTGTIFGQWIQNNTSGSTIIVYTVSNKIQVYYNNSGGLGSLTSTTTLSTGTWYNITLRFDGSTLKLYINGNEEASGSLSAINNSAQNLILGAYSNSGQTGFQAHIDGKISNVSIFNEALTSTEVLKLYANGVPQDLTNFTPQPVAWYPLGSNSFWNGSQWTVRDMIGSNDGTGQNIGVDGLVGDAPRSEANGTGTNMDIPTNLEGSTKWSDNNSWSINMSESSRVENTP